METVNPISKTKLIPINQTSLLNDAHEKLNGISPEMVSSLSNYDHLRITKEKYIEHPEPVITIGKALIATPGNITAIGAAAKTGKTAIVGVIAAGAISETGDIDGFPELEVKPNNERKAVVSFDTEQSEYDQQYNVNAILKRAGIDETPDYFRAYNIRQLKIDQYQQVTNDICEQCKIQFGGIHLIIIDGGADYILSVNDESAASLIIQYFIHIAIKYECPVLVIVHQNPGSDKERGHFGSEIQRKCYGLLTLTREGDISTIAPKIMRKAGNADVPLISFKYCKEKGYHVAVDGMAENDKGIKERQKLKELAEAVFKPLNSHSHKESVAMIMQHTNKGLTTAKTMLGNMEGFGYVDKGDDKLYRLNMEKVNEGQRGSIDPT